MPLAAVAAVGVAAGVAGGIMEQQEARRQANVNADLTRETNALNYKQFKEARGSEGSAILPEYGGDSERQLYQQALAFSQVINSLPPEQQMAVYDAILQSQEPAIQAGNRTIQDIYSGALDQTRLDQAAPVMAARSNLAGAQASGIDAALLAAKNQIAAEEARKGYTGGGSHANNRILAATIPARQQAAQAVLSAVLANATEKQAIQNQGHDLRIRSLDVAPNRANQLMQLANAPATALAARAQASQAPLQFFKLNPGTPPRNEAPQLSAVPTAGGIIATGVSQAAGQYGNYIANQQLAKQYASGAPNPTAWGTYSGGGSQFSQTPEQAANFAAMQEYYGG